MPVVLGTEISSITQNASTFIKTLCMCNTIYIDIKMMIILYVK